MSRCASCGKPMWFHNGSQRYYRCSGRPHRTCTAGMVQADRVEAQASAMVQALTLPLQLQEELARRILALAKVEQAQPKPTVDRATIELKLQRLWRAYTDNLIDDAEYEQRRDSLKAQLVETEQEHLPSSAVDIQRAAAQLADIPALFEVATPTERSVLLGKIFSQLWAEPHALVAITPRGIYTPLLALCREGRCDWRPRGVPKSS